MEPRIRRGRSPQVTSARPRVLPPPRRLRRHWVHGLGSSRMDSRGARGARPRPPMTRRPVWRAVTSHGATQSPGSRSPGRERPSSVFAPASASRAGPGDVARIESDGLERRPRGQTPTADDAATCLATGDEPTCPSSGGVTLPGSRAPVLGFYPPTRRLRRHRVHGLGSSRMDSRGAPRGQTPTADDAATCLASGNESWSHSIAGVALPGSRAPVLGFYPRLGVSGGIGSMGSGRVGWTREAPMMRRPV